MKFPMSTYAPASGGGSSLWSVLGTYEAASAEASHLFSFTAVDFDDDSELVLVYDCSATLQLALQCRVNAIAGVAYYQDGRRITGGAETLLDISGVSEWELLSTTALTGVNVPGAGVAHILLPKGGTLDRVKIINHSIASVVNEQLSGAMITATTSLTSVEVLTSTSTWEIGARFTLYKVARA